MTYMLAWAPLVNHVSAWTTPGDVWAVFRGAHFVGWGYLGGVYQPSNEIISFPGIEILLAPVAMLSGALGLSESYSPFLLAHPTAALLLEPVELLLTSSVIFATDALAERLCIDKRIRIALCFAVCLVGFELTAIWGHAEDALAITFLVHASIAFSEKKWAKCGWMFALGIAMQPLVLLALPLLAAATPHGRRILLCARSLLPSALLLLVAYLGNPSGTYRAVVEQPAFPGVNHPTPWLHFAVRLSGGGPSVRSAQKVPRFVHGRFVIETTSTVLRHPLVVSGGIGRTLYLIVALALGLFVWRNPQSFPRIVWLMAGILAARCLFEAVMCPYYLGPPLIVALAVVASRGWRRFLAAVGIGLATSVYSYFHWSPWVWWAPVVVGLAAILVLGRPPSQGRELESEDDDRSEVTDVSRDRGPLLLPV